jgi:1-deoxy-D-xylulose-5-phosphate reductoisomerase
MSAAGRGSRWPLGVALLGATGSIGRQALDVIDRFPDRFRVVGLLSGRRLPDRSARYSVRASDPDASARVREMVTDPDCDLVLVAVPGACALEPTLAALDAGKRVAIATKEVLVMAGEVVMRRARPGAIRPVDSEHSAIWQCLWGEAPESVARLILTATGGPLLRHPELDWRTVTVEQALRHPTWSMGPKVTVDSATLMNKGLEVIEAARLFALNEPEIEVLVHPQSVIHGMVCYADGSVMAQLGAPDMRVPIAHTLAWPARMTTTGRRLDLAAVARLEFFPPEPDRFPALRLARAALRAGGGAPTILSAANEVAVAAFLARRIGFLDIASTAETVLDRLGAPDLADLETVIALDAAARAVANTVVNAR